MADACDMVGNPSSVHTEGRAARGVIEAARRNVAAIVGADPTNVTLTSGATEANNLVIAHAGNAGWRVFASAIEHPSVLDVAPRSRRLAVTADGTVDLDALRAALEDGEGAPVLVCLMLANNETGVIQPVAEAAEIVHDHGGYLHVDAVQAAGKIPVDLAALGADYLALSAHKIGGPAGTGALIRRPGAPEPAPMLRGGGQERRVRAGTENLIGIAGFGAAAAEIPDRLAAIERISALRDWLEAEIVSISPSATVFGADAPRLGNTICFGAPGIAGETAVIRFDLGGVALGSGSACSSGKVAPSHVLEAMGYDRQAAGSAIRISLGPETTKADVAAAARIWQEIASTAQTTSAAA